LLRVSKSDRIKVKVPIDLKGEAPGHKAGGVVTLLVHEIEIECTPDTIPEKIHAQIGKLELGGVIKAHDLELPKGAKVTHAGDETIVSCTLPAKKGEEPAVAAGAAEPEVIGRKPAEEGEGEAAEG
jgi:large subunit ribosomal protein L25